MGYGRGLCVVWDVRTRKPQRKDLAGSGSRDEWLGVPVFPPVERFGFIGSSPLRVATPALNHSFTPEQYPDARINTLSALQETLTGFAP